jgi:hypothetical protein
MLLSPADHDALVDRVTRLVAPRGIERSVVEDAVRRVLGTLAVAVEPEAATHTVVVMAESLPDLASRLRSAAPGADWTGMASATEGRHTVVAARVGPAGLESLRSAALSVGARVIVRGAQA